MSRSEVKRRMAIDKIVQTLRKVRQSDRKLDKYKLASMVMKDYHISLRTAMDYIKDAEFKLEYEDAE